MTYKYILFSLSNINRYICFSYETFLKKEFLIFFFCYLKHLLLLQLIWWSHRRLFFLSFDLMKKIWDWSRSLLRYISLSIYFSEISLNGIITFFMFLDILGILAVITGLKKDVNRTRPVSFKILLLLA